MHFLNLIKQISKDKEILMCVDMDGVLASYDVGNPSDFINKRPLTENIKKLEQISKLPNVELKILSICRKNSQIEEKNIWLDKNAPFFKKENRVIISKENITNKKSYELKIDYLKSINTTKQIILVDDDNLIIKKVVENLKNIIVFQDSELID